MKKLITPGLLTGILLSICIGTAHAQQFNALNDTLVARYNRGDFRGMYALESDSLKAKDPEKGFVDYFSGLVKETGRITSSRSTGQKGIHHYFEWFGEKKNERFDIVGAKPGIMNDYFVSDFLIQPDGRNTPAATDNPLKNKIDLTVKNAAAIYMADQRAVGMSIGILQDGKMCTYNYGEIKKGSGVLPSADNVYNVGSIAKTFVSTLLAQAVVEGKIKPDDDIRKYLPGSYPNLEYKGVPVRVVNLANHTSGLPGSAIVIPPRVQDSIKQLTDSARFTYLSTRYAKFNADSMLLAMHSFTVDTLPGTKYRYNGTAVSVIILLLERVYHEPYEQILQRYLTTHLDMHQTSSLITEANRPKFPQGYNGKGEPMPMKAMSNVSQFITSPSINSTVRDMMKYLKANIAETDPAIKLTHQVTYSDGQGNSIGLNWMMDKDADGIPRIYHSGQTGLGFTSLCVFYPHERTGYVVFVNDMIGQNRLFDLVQAIRDGE